ncbi:type II toxin-antitoxin system Phd/YefM family antitoxin [Actinokineospora alba]|uniref:type II toxin-antitoxin system Phd/YefM family antitoxin n=1 Tax=Actinokineospora alba TaxID=504798 RepID=UPI000A9A68C0|nr:prevent-host-death protein [Actinokineospora alba]TDP64986.1 hypothetical protein C8E96_0464 [Actinokineospora alba]
MRVDVSMLRSGLSRYLALVRRGGTVTVIDRGQVIARIVPARAPTVPEQLVAERQDRLTKRPKRSAPTPVRADGLVSDLVAEQRR